MTFDEWMAEEKKAKTKRKNKDDEHRIQSSCVQWFRLAHSDIAGLLYAVPNGGRRDAVTGRKMKEEGVLAGVSDLNLDVPNRFYHGLRIEMKTRTGRQQKSQIEFQHLVESQGYKYAICRSFDDFKRCVDRYLHDME